MLRHFAEKQRIVYEDGNVLFEAVQDVPLIFEEALTSTLDQIVTATDPLRVTLRQQVELGRPLPQFKPDELVLAAELYTYLSGNAFFIAMPDDVRAKYVAAYQAEYSPAILDELNREQIRALRNGNALDPAAYMFLRRFKGAPYRIEEGSVWDDRKKIWSEVYLRVDEVEAVLNSDLPTKRSDTAPIRTADGELSAWELMFLMPKRALADGRDGGLCDVTRYCAIGRMDRQMVTTALSKSDANGKLTLFEIYGQSDEDRQLSIRPHSLRHLQNTELFSGWASPTRSSLNGSTADGWLRATTTTTAAWQRNWTRSI